MSAQPAPPSQAPDSPADFARPALERQMAGLEALADIGLEIARGLAALVARKVAAVEPDPGFDAPAITLAYDRAARAVRLSYALQQTVIDALRGVDSIEADRAERAERTRALQTKVQDPVRARKLQIGKVVDGIIADAHGEDGEALDRHVREAERLRDHEVLDNVLGRPASEVIADICRLLGLEPNWEGVAFEAWAVEERRSGEVGGPLKSPPPWLGKRPGIRGRLLKSDPPPFPEALPLKADTENASPSAPPRPEIAPVPPPYSPPPDPDALPGYAVGLPGELPPERPKRRLHWA